MTFPIVSVVRPADLSGQTNGQLDRSLLRDVGPRKGWQLHHLAARAWEALRAAALRDGIVLSYSGNPYRDFAGQESLFRSRYTTDGPTALDKSGRVWNGVRWYRHRGAPAAVPGTSNHGWGLAVDVALDADGDLDFDWPVKALDRKTLNWLVENAPRFGWSWELKSEPWHIRYVVGDAVPQAVLDHEAGATVPAPPAIPERPPVPSTYTVKKGDSWWGIAHRVLGDGGRWQELRDFNGARNVIHPGQVLRIPGTVEELPAPTPAPVTPATYTVQKGDSYWRIASRTLGSGLRWREVAAVNGERPLHPGMVISLPPGARV